LTESEREALSLLWRLGFLTADQLSSLSSSQYSVRWAQDVLERLSSRGLVERTNRRPSWDVRSGRRPSIYYLVGEGVFLAGSTWEKITKRSAAKIYGGICQERLLNHALLRNEYLAELATAVRAHKSGLMMDFLGGERHAWQRAHPIQARSPGCYPDGVAVIHHDTYPEFELNVLVEAHTGSQNSPKTMSRKVDKYCKPSGAIYNQVSGTGPDFVQSRVVFVAPNQREAEQARRLARAVEDGLYVDYRGLKGTERCADPADFFLFTDVDLIHNMGSALENVYFSLGSYQLGPLFRSISR